MKKLVFLKSALLVLFVFISISCVTTNKAQVNERSQKYIVTGSFVSKTHSNGTMKFILFDDGTLEGDWVTENNTITIEATGYYIIKNGEIIMTASGISMLRSNIKSRVIIFSGGKINNNESSGQFVIAIDEVRFPNDTGTWTAQIEK